MPTLSVTKNWPADGAGALTSAHLTSAATSVETFVNTTKLDEDNIQSGGISTAAIADGAVTKAKLAAVGQQISSSSSTYSMNSTTLANVTNLSVTLTTTGRPVFVGLISDGSGTASYIGVSSTTDTPRGYIKLLRNSQTIYDGELYLASSSAAACSLRVPPGAVWQIDRVSAGSQTYTVQVKGVQGSDTVAVNLVKLIAYEM